MRTNVNRQRSLSAVDREKLTVAEVCAELKIHRRTFYDWCAKGNAPRRTKLPNGDWRITRADLDKWLTEREVA